MSEAIKVAKFKCCTKQNVSQNYVSQKRKRYMLNRQLKCKKKRDSKTRKIIGWSRVRTDKPCITMSLTGNVLQLKLRTIKRQKKAETLQELVHIWPDLRGKTVYFIPALDKCFEGVLMFDTKEKKHMYIMLRMVKSMILSPNGYLH